MAKRKGSAGNSARRKKSTNKYSRRSGSNKLGTLCIILQTIASIALMAVLYLLGMIPDKYLILVAAILFFLWCVTLNSQVARRKRGTLGKVFSLLMAVVMFTGSYYVAQANNMIGKITGSNYKVDKMVVAVRADDSAETIEDAANYTYGVQFEKGADNIQTAVADIEKQVGVDTIEVKEYDSVQDQAQALVDGDCDAIIYNSAYTSLMEEAVDGYSDKVKVLYTFNIRVELDFGNSTGATDDSIIKEPFTVYISGIDVYGDVSETSRSDVNIIMTVNPNTKQILLTTTPRDYYVTIPGVSGDARDKLTHAGIYGVDASMATLENLYGIDISYYARVNFTSLETIVDALGGVDVDSEYAFTTSNDSGLVMNVVQGTNHFNGKQALAFSRERQNVPGGDNQRGKDQQAVLTAMIKKMVSPAILTGANGIITSVSGNVDTNMSMEQIQKLIKTQLADAPKWSIKSMAAEGTGDNQMCYSYSGKALYVMQPNQESVDAIKAAIDALEAGETLDDVVTTE
mgnify:CR=1 FL=1